MKIICRTVSVFAFGVIFAVPATYAKTYTLTNGKKITDPYVISKRPNGLEIGHKTGITFIKFEMLPEELQKKYNYNPAAAKTYEETLAAKKQADAEKEKAEAAKKAVFNKEMDKRRFNASIDRLELDIVKYEKRIKFLKSEIAKLEKQNENFINKSTKLAGTSVSGDNDRGRARYRDDNYGWDGGYVVVGGSSGGRYAETSKRFTMRKIGDEYSTNKRRIKTYRTELDMKEIELIKMKKRLKAGRAQQKKNK